MIYLEPKLSKRGFKPDPVMDLVEWADTFLYLPKESASEYGKYRSSRTPFVIEPLKELSMTSKTSKVIVEKPSQQAATTMGLIMILGIIDMWGGPIQIFFPTERLGTSFSKKRLDPTIRDTKRLQGKIKEKQSKDSSDTILEKIFPGGSLKIVGANSGASFRSETVKYLILDDFDDYEANIGGAEKGEGDPGELAERRTGSFKRHKIYYNSTPTIRGLSNIDNAFLDSSMGFWSIPCPRCGKYQKLLWPQLKFDRENLSWVYYECLFCQFKIPESDKATFLFQGKYIHEHPERKDRGFNYNALSAPVGFHYTWKIIADTWLKSYKNPQKRKAFFNTLMAEAYEEEGSQPAWEIISARAEPYRITEVPERALILSAGVDVQENRLVLVVIGWGRDEEAWLLLKDEIYGNPEKKEVWNELDEKVLNRKWQHASGIDLVIISMAVDAGYLPNVVYNYARIHQNVIAVKGQPGPGRPVIGRPTKQDVDYEGKIIKNGVLLWPIGDFTVKTIIYNRLSQKKEAETGPEIPGYIHFPIGLEDDFYQQLTAEKKITRYVKGYPVEEWVKIQPRNDYLDAFKYAYAAALRAGLQSVDFNRLEKDLEVEKEQIEIKKDETKKQESPIASQELQDRSGIDSIRNFKRPSWINR